MRIEEVIYSRTSNNYKIYVMKYLSEGSFSDVVSKQTMSIYS